MSNGRPSSVQHLSTNKNDKNEEKDKKSTISSSSENEIFDFWENNGLGVSAPVTMQNLDYWVEDFEKIGSSPDDANQLLIKAMNVAINNDGRTYNYVNGILQNWKNRKLTKVELVDAYENERSTKSKSKSKPKQKKPFQNFEQNDDQYDNLPF